MLVLADRRSNSGWMTLPTHLALHVRADRRSGTRPIAWPGLHAHRVLRGRADRRSGSQRMALPAHNSRTSCLTGLGRWTVWFGAVGTARTSCFTGSVGWTVLFAVDGTAAHCVMRVLALRTVLFGAVGTMFCWCGGIDGPVRRGWHGQDCPAHCAVRVLADERFGSGGWDRNAYATCLAGLGRRKVWFGADGTPRALSLLVPAWRKVWFGATRDPCLAVSGQMALLLHRASQILADGQSGLRWIARSGPSCFKAWRLGLTEGLVQSGWHCLLTMPCGFRHDGRSDSGLMKLPVHLVMRVLT